MGKIIGYKDNRQYLWNCMTKLREVIAYDRYHKNTSALDKELQMYQEYLYSYIN